MADPSPGELAPILARLDLDPDRLHFDVTPAVLALQSVGLDGALAALPLLDAASEETRLHAWSVVVGAAMRELGWVPGQGFADEWLGQERSQRLFAELGTNLHEMAPPARSVAVTAWRSWLLAARVPLPVTRTRGPVRGSFELVRRRVVAGQAIWCGFHLEATRAITFSTDGDDTEPWPARYGLSVFDARGGQVCGSDAPPVVTRSPGGVAHASAGHDYDDSIVLNPACPALSEPGRYRLVLRRVLATDGAVAGCSLLAPPDTTVPASPGGEGARCFEALRALPAIVTETWIHIEPYDRARVTEAFEREINEIERGVDPGARTLYALWLRRRIACGAPLRTRPVARWMRSVVARLPDALPERECARP